MVCAAELKAFVKTALLHAISLATTAVTCARNSAAHGRSKTRQLRAEFDRANSEIALIREELDLKDSRWGRLSTRRRPHYSAVQRLRILQLKAARGWSCEQAARAFLIDEQTLQSVGFLRSVSFWDRCLIAALNRHE